MQVLEIFLALAAYGGLHSLTAASTCKSSVSRLVGERAFLGLYRLSYSIVSVLTFLPVLSLLARPGPVVWRAEGLVASGLVALRVLALVGVATALLQIDTLRFLGIKQAIACLCGRQLPLPPERLAAQGVYRLVRHPLYFFSIIALWSAPVMTESALGLALGATSYFALGSILEERRLARAFGAEYEAYRRAVPWLIPGPGLRRSRASGESPPAAGPNVTPPSGSASP